MESGKQGWHFTQFCLLCQRAVFSITRCGLLGLFLQDLLAAVPVTHKLHLSNTKAFHLPLTERINKNVLSLLFFYEFQLKMFVLSTQRPNLLSENKLITNVRTRKTCCWVWNTHKLTYQLPPLPTPTHFQPVSNLHPALSQILGRDLLFILLQFKQSRTINKESHFSTHNCQ